MTEKKQITLDAKASAELIAGQVVRIGNQGIRLVHTGKHSEGNRPTVATAIVELGTIVETTIDDDQVDDLADAGETIPTDYDGADVFERLNDDLADGIDADPETQPPTPAEAATDVEIGPITYDDDTDDNQA